MFFERPSTPNIKIGPKVHELLLQYEKLTLKFLDLCGIIDE